MEEVEEDKQIGIIEEKGKGRATDPHVDKPGDAPPLNTKCCEPTITGDTNVFLYVHYVDDDAF
jgi:hypothetical protein